MTTAPGSIRPSEVPETEARPRDGLAGVPADSPANLLEQARDNAAPTAPPPSDIPAAFAGELAPYRLEDLLCGLPVIGDDAPAAALPPDEVVAVVAMEAEDKDEEEDGGTDTVPVEEPEWDPSGLSAGNLVAALHALAEEAPPPALAPAGDDAVDGKNDVLLLTEEHQAATASTDLEGALLARIDEIVAAHWAYGVPAGERGDPALPERLDALEFLLAEPPPAEDFAALDALYACWPKGTQNCASRALLAVAHNLSRNFGLPGKLPMASAKAWRMLAPSVFEAELAKRLADVGAFIAEWQGTQRHFLILEFGEIELIEYLFEALHPGYHADLLTGVMNFKVLSNRRMGLLRRVPNRMKKLVTQLVSHDKERALTELAHAKALLEQVGSGTGFAPIVEAAAKAREEVEKMMKAVANAGAIPPSPAPGGGLPLGRLG